jgi:SAM-dependent methyltransferase
MNAREAYTFWSTTYDADRNLTRDLDLIVCNLVLEHIRDLSFIFSEASRVLIDAGCMFICELHPFRQYQGTQANFQRGPESVVIPAFVHHISEFIETAAKHALSLLSFKEWWDDEAEQIKPPRLVSFMFKKRVQCQETPTESE